MVKPYVDYDSDEGFIRIFDYSVSEDELIWHRDERDRLIKVIEGNGWKFQYENQLPFVLVDDHSYYIDAYSYHRLIKGGGDLTLRIIEK